MWATSAGWRIGIADSYSVENKCGKRWFLVISFWFLDEIASVVSLHRNDRKKR